MTIYIDDSINLALRPDIGPPQPDFAAHHAKIGAFNFLYNEDADISTTDSQETVENLLTPGTYDKWRPETTAPVIDIDLGQELLLDYLGLASHDLGANNATVLLELAGEDLVYFPVLARDIGINTPLFLEFDDSIARYARLTITSDAPIELAVLYIGKILQMLRPIYGGHTPILTSANNVYSPQNSDGGNFLGRTLVRRGYQTSVSFRNFKAQWYRQFFQPLVNWMQVYPYFWQWNPLEHPEEVSYSWTSENISPVNSGIKDLMDVTFNMQALG